MGERGGHAADDRGQDSNPVRCVPDLASMVRVLPR